MVAAMIVSVLVIVVSFSVMLLPVASINAAYQARSLSFQPKKRANAEQEYASVRIRAKLMSLIRKERIKRLKTKSTAPTLDKNIVIGFYANWNPKSFLSFRTHINSLSYVMPDWYSLTNDPELLTSLKEVNNNSTDKQTPDEALCTLANEHHLPILPILNNADEDQFVWEPLKQLLLNPVRQHALITRLLSEITANDYDGINIDFEPPYEQMTSAEVPEAQRLIHDALPKFMAALKQAFVSRHLLVTQDLPVNDEYFDYEKLSDINDLSILMLYDQHNENGNAGPIAAQDWTEETVDRMLKVMDSSKTILGLGNYCLDWPISLAQNGDITWSGVGTQVPLGVALNIAREAKTPIEMNDDELNPYFTYLDADNQTHIIYMLDAITAYNQVQALRGYELRGAALWALGSEDPTIWKFFNKQTLTNPVDPSVFATIDFKREQDVQTSPDGDELMQVASLAAPGMRALTTDQDGLIVSENYISYPTPNTIRQFDGRGKTIALTFDDGPNPKYTPQVMRILRENHINATFFVVGEMAASYPEIVRQCWHDGNEIGNHTYTHPHITTVSPSRVQMEINATQLVIEGLTGHMSMLFRAPYGESPDADNLTAASFPLMQQLQREGYLVVGWNIDTLDWHEKLSPQSTKDIIDRIDENLGQNHVILMHDSGGNREATMTALPEIIHHLKAKGYKFVTISQLMGGAEWKHKLFPPIPPGQSQIVGLDRTLFETWFFTGFILQVIFFAAIILGILRLLLFSVLAILQYRHQHTSQDLRTFTPPVTVAVPAYNEANVVCRTIDSLLNSDYPEVHVIAVDDGSTDDTLDVLRAHFTDHPRVTIVSKQNGGKSSALNEAFRLAQTDIVVCLDADTLLAPDAIRHLVQAFINPKVGAVAGNVKVGNRINLLTLWQSLEYITSQNFDRQAFAALKSVPVIPGAIGAWRKSVVDEVGGFEANTLAEDTDLTFKIRLLGYDTLCNNAALAYTEAPDNLQALAKQRFRWSFGILQALWKHHRKLFRPRYGAFSMVIMPSMWIYNFLMQALAPLVDLLILISLFSAQRVMVLYYAAIYFVVDFIVSLIVLHMDREDKKQLLWLFWQRIFYREFLYYIVIKAMLAALRGGIVGWGKLHRKDTVSLPQGNV